MPELNKDRYSILKEKLLSLVGKSVKLPSIEEDLDDILNKGIFLNNNNNCVYRKGRPSQCHANSFDLFEHVNGDDFRIMTGYALSDDGVWHQHSWCYDLKEKLIYETTEKRISYFGFIMSLEECDQFCFDNF